MILNIHIFMRRPEYEKTWHIRCCCVYCCCQCYIHKMGQTRLRAIFVYCLSCTQIPNLKATTYRFSRLELRMQSSSTFHMLLCEVMLPLNMICLIRISFANQIGLNLNSIDIGHNNVMYGLSAYIIFIMSLLCQMT